MSADNEEPKLTYEQGQAELSSMREKYGPDWPLRPSSERLAAHEVARNALKEAIGELETAQHMIVDQAITDYRLALIGGGS